MMQDIYLITIRGVTMALEEYKSEQIHPLLDIFSKDPGAVKGLIDDLAEELKEELLIALDSDVLFLSCSNDWGETGYPPSGEQSIKGWRLLLDIPKGRISYSSWSEMGIVVAYLDTSVDVESILQHAEAGIEYDYLIEDEEAYQEAEDRARLSYRGYVEPCFLSCEPQTFIPNCATFDACREAVINAITKEIELQGI